MSERFSKSKALLECTIVSKIRLIKLCFKKKIFNLLLSKIK